jgi:hypothetical protein
MKRRPFCSDAAASAAFQRWVRHFESLGVELNEADRLLVGLLASREANLQALRTAIGRARIDRRLELEIAEDRAARAFGLALDRAERVLAPRCNAEEEKDPALAAGAEGRVLSFARRSPDAVERRIVAALSTGRSSTKAELRARVKGGQKEFLAAIRNLVAEGKVDVEGRGRRGYPRRYRLAKEEGHVRRETSATKGKQAHRG